MTNQQSTYSRFDHAVLAGISIYAVGDIHGRLDLVEDIQARIDADIAARPDPELPVAEIYLGDYIDRGPHSADVVEILIRRAMIQPCVFLRGNHEALMLGVLSGKASAGAVLHWLKIGGEQTALSYGVANIPRDIEDVGRFVAELRSVVPDSHRRFFAVTVLSFDFGPYCFVHAGIRPGIPRSGQCEEDLLWIREPFLSSPAEHGVIVVHGHTPMRRPDFHANRINIDTGAFATGNLTAIVIDQNGARVLWETAPA